MHSSVVGHLLLCILFLPALAQTSGRIGEYLDVMCPFHSALNCPLSVVLLLLYLENLPYKSAETVNSLKAFNPISWCLILTRSIGLQRTLFSSLLISIIYSHFATLALWLTSAGRSFYVTAQSEPWKRAGLNQSSKQKKKKSYELNLQPFQLLKFITFPHPLLFKVGFLFSLYTFNIEFKVQSFTLFTTHLCIMEDKVYFSLSQTLLLILSFNSCFCPPT